MSKSIFITGRACRLPGASSVGAFEDLLFAGKDAVGEIPDDRWLKEYFLHPVAGIKGKTYTFAAGVLDDLWGFDPAAFGLSPREASQMDPQQRLMLQVAWEALEDAGLPPDRLRGQRVGVYVGCSAMPHAARLAQDAAITDSYLMTGNTLALVSNRISHVLDLRGPSMTVDTACSSSLVALRLAQDALRAGLIDVAVVGAVNALLDPFHYVGFSSARMLSPTGRCQPFSAGADGYVRAEGAVAFVLERRTEASLAPRRALARLVAVETNTDGWTVNVALPSQIGQADLLRQVYGSSGIDPERLLFVEAHGTGTLAGDPVEAQALGEVLGQARQAALPIGSVKSNIGHLEPASGAAGLLKALVALEHEALPATLHAERLNPAIGFDALNLMVARDRLPLQIDAWRRFAGVSSFGFGGANAHAILEHVARRDVPVARAKPLPGAPVLVVSARTEQSLQMALQDWGGCVATAAPGDMGELAAQAHAFRGVQDHRVAVICDAPEAAARALETAAAGGDDPRLVRLESGLRDAPAVFVFSGNGSQHPGMSTPFLQSDRAYAAMMRRIDRGYAERAGWSILKRLASVDLAEDLADAAVAQPLLFADQMAMVAALAARGLTPAAVMGHSGGEVAAACAAGILSLGEALDVLHHRCVLAATTRGEGGMAAIQAPLAEVEVALAEAGLAVTVAAVNSPKSVTVVGPQADLEAFLRLARRTHRWPAVRLNIDYPYHGRPMERLRAPLMQKLERLSPGAGKVPFISSVVADVVPGGQLDPAYWCDNFCLPVQFAGAMDRLRHLGFAAFVEIGPQPVLQAYMAACLEGEKAQILPSGEREAGQDGVAPVDRIMARVRAAGLRVDPAVAGLVPRDFRRDLPKQRWANAPIRIDRTRGILNRLGDFSADHPLLGREEGLAADVWHSEMDAHLVPLICDHRIGGKVMVPATALLEILLAAAGSRTGRDSVTLSNVDILSPVILSRQAITDIQTRLSAGEQRVWLGSAPHGQDAPVQVVAKGSFAPGRMGEDMPPAPDPAPDAADRDGAELYASARRRGLDYGPAFARLRRSRTVAEGVVEVFIDPAPSLLRNPALGYLDVIGADAALHGVMALLELGPLADTGAAMLPVRIARLEVYRTGAQVASARLRLVRSGTRSVLVDVELYDADGAGIGRLEGVRLQAARLIRDVAPGQHMFRQIALPVAAAAPALPDLGPAICSAAEAEDLAPEDDGGLMVEAALHAVVAEGLASLADGEGCVGLGLMQHPYLMLLGEICLRSGHGVAVDGALRIAEARPAAAEVLDGVAAAHPGRVADLAALTHLRAVLPDLLRGLVAGAGVPGVASVFGRDLLAGLSEETLHRERIIAAVARAVQEAVPQGAAALRIAEVTDGRPGVIAALLPRLAPERAVFTALLAPGAEGSVAAMTLPVDRVSQVDLAALGEGQRAGFDLILSVGALSRLPLPTTVLTDLTACLRAGGQMVLIEPAPSDMADAIGGLDEERPSQEETVPRRLGGDEVTAMLRLAGFAAPGLTWLPDGCGGAQLVVVRQGAEALPAAPRPDEAMRAALREALAVGAGDRWQRVPSSGEGAGTILVTFPPAADAAMPRTAVRIALMRDLLRGGDVAEGARLLCVVPGGSGQSLHRCDPVQSAVWTFLRSVANEYPLLEFRRHDVDPDMDAEEAAMRIALFEADPGGRETEVIHRRAGDSVLRVVHGPVAEMAGAPFAPEMRSLLRAPVTGGLDDLAWDLERRGEPGAGEVEIAVEAAGLNYRDVMWTMGLLPEEALEKGFAGPGVGIECAGRVLRCGAGVDDLRPGDRVVTFGPGCLASHLVLPAHLVTRLPEGIDSEAAATLPAAFFTAWYALVTLAGVKAGEWVLIHGGAGGVGLAAIQVAQALGARVVATAGTAVKRSFLRAAGVQHVLDSRSLGFADAIRGLTGGRGVDVVLNSLAGPAMALSVDCLAPFERFLELGKQDFYTNTTLGLRALRENIAYHGIDVDQMLADRPDEAREIFASIMGWFAEGRLRPLPYRSFAGAEAKAAFRWMQRSAHIGKIVIRPLPPGEVVPALPGQAAFRPSPDPMHVIVGGLGGLGLELAEGLVDRGARRIALMGRRAVPDERASAAVARWRSQGCEVLLVACDVADADALDAALQALRPLAGITHSAMVLDDMPLAQVTDAAMPAALAAKIAGAENLDRLTRDDRLDYFVLFTSLATLIGNHGQSVYVAANGFLEGLCRDRRARGLPGLAVGWGGIGDVGYLARDHGRAAMVRRMSGNVEFTGLQAIRVLERLLAGGDTVAPVVHVSPMEWQAVGNTLRTLGEPSFQLLRALGRREQSADVEEDLRALLVGLPRDRAEQRMVAWLTGRIAGILQVSEKSVAVDRAVSDLGIDSLMGVELGLTLQDALGADVPTAAVSGSFTITEIAVRIVRFLHGTAGEEGGEALPGGAVLAQHVAVSAEAAE